MAGPFDKESQVEYRRLPGKKKVFLRQNTLWLGEDHLLAVESNYFNERYNRLYFRDFQAIIVRKTNRFAACNIVTATAAGLCAVSMIAAGAWHYLGLSLVSGIALLLSLIALAMNLIRGATCTCHVGMPLAVHNLQSVCRLKYAQRILAEITPLVQKYQGPMDVDEIRSQWLRGEVSGTLPDSKPRVNGLPPTGAVQEGSCFFHTLLSGALLLEVLVTVLEFHSGHSMVRLANVVTGALLFALVVTALVKQHRRSLPRTLKGWTWTVAVMLVVFNLVAMFAATVILTLKRGPRSQADPLSSLLEFTPDAHPFMSRIYVCYIIVSVVLAIWGLAVIAVHRRQSRNRPSSGADASASIREGSGA